MEHISTADGLLGNIRIFSTRVRPLSSLAAALLAVAIITVSGCGGGGSNELVTTGAAGAGAASSGVVLELNGTAATGQPMANALLSASCSVGSGSTTTAADGSWRLSIAGAVAPCVIQVTSGSITLHSYAAAAGVVNVTPLTEEILRLALSGTGTTPATLFASPAAVPLSPAQLQAAEASVKAKLVSLGVDTAAIGGSLLTQPFAADHTGIDGVLDLVGATFVAKYKLTFASNGAGSVTTSPGGIANCAGATCTATFDPGTTVTLTAAPTSGNAVSGWGGACASAGTSAPTCTVTMSSDQTANVAFSGIAPPTYTLTFTASGPGTVTSTPSGVSCVGASCSASFTAGTVVTLTPSPATNPKVWSGACASAGATCTVTMSANQTAGATFTPLYAATLSVTGSGTVTSSSGGISCPGTCNSGSVIPAGTVVTLTATPSTGFLVTGWTGACATSGTVGTTGTCSVTMNASQPAGAIFTRVHAAIFSVVGSGTVTSSSGGISCPGTCNSGAVIPVGTVVTFTANPSAGYLVTGWTGACASSGTVGATGTCSVTMNTDQTAGVIFTQAFALTVTLSGGSGGLGTSSVGSASTPAGSPSNISCTATNNPCSASFPALTSVTLSANPGPSQVFSGWSGGGCSGTGTCVVAASVDSSVTAQFADAPASYLKVSVAGGGTVTSDAGAIPGTINCTAAVSGYTAGCSATFNTGAPVTLTAAPTAGYAFAGWLNSASSTSTQTTCTGTTNPCLIASKPAATQYLTAIFTPTATNPPPGPIQLYTDITSGPIGCVGVPTACGLYAGENDDGIYLSVFGKNFGTTGLGTTTKVYVDNIEVATYKPTHVTALPNIGASRGRADVQQINTQVGKFRLLTNTGLDGQALPIKVVTDGRVAVDPNSLTFTVNPGRIYFVNNLSGVDTADTTTGGTFAAPFLTVQKTLGLNFSIAAASTAGAWGRVQAGDFLVMRGTGTPYTRQAGAAYFMMTLNKSGSAPGVAPQCTGCTGTGPITLMGYPGEDVFINGLYDGTATGGTISSADTARIQEFKGHWINIVGLRIEGGRNDGAIDTQAGGSHWRVVNNELTAATAVGNVVARAAGAAGHGNCCTAGIMPGPGYLIIGNNVHDIFNGPDNGTSNFENHGVYLFGLGKTEIAYNQFRKIRGGNGISTFANGTNNDFNIDDVDIHHNIFQDIGKHGINLADGTRNNIRIWNNIIYDTDRAGIRFSTTVANNTQIFNNTIYNTNRINNGATAAIMSEGVLGISAIDLRNNIIRPVTGAYAIINGAFPGTATNNLWFGGTGTNPATTFSTSSLETDPKFVSTTAGVEDFRLQATSPAIGAGTNAAAVSAVVTNDLDVATTAVTQTTRPIGGSWDIGAYER